MSIFGQSRALQVYYDVEDVRPEPHDAYDPWPSTPPALPPTSWSSFGSSSTRGEDDKTCARAYFEETIAQEVNATTAVVFTDGSCSGNPGLAGAGAVIAVPGDDEVHLSRHVGFATSTAAELFAIRIALHHVLSRACDGAPFDRVCVFPESQTAIGLADKGNHILVRSIRGLWMSWELEGPWFPIFGVPGIVTFHGTN